MWEIKIRREANGYIVSYPSENDENLMITEVYQDYNKEAGQLYSLRDVLNNVMMYFGESYSKHNKKNIVVKIIKNKDL